MNSLVTTSFEGTRVRTTIDESGVVWFSAKDSCQALHIANHRDAVGRLDDDERASVLLDGSKVTGINESGLYSLILRSNKPEAKRFKKWVTSVLLPSVRKSGAGGWLEARNEGKAVRKLTTDIIKTFIDYAKRQGSQSADMYYTNFSKLVNTSLLEIEGKKPANLRDQLNTFQLHQVSVAEQIIAKSIVDCIGQQRHYKDVYQIAKDKIQIYASTVGRSRIGASDRQLVGLLEVGA